MLIEKQIYKDSSWLDCDKKYYLTYIIHKYSIMLFLKYGILLYKRKNFKKRHSIFKNCILNEYQLKIFFQHFILKFFKFFDNSSLKANSGNKSKDPNRKGKSIVIHKQLEITKIADFKTLWRYFLYLSGIKLY